MKKFSTIVKVFLISILLSVNSFADHFRKPESYIPDGEYRLFGSGRGSISNIRGGFNESWQFGITAGNIAVNNLTYTGTVDYQQDFSGHGHQVHSPFSSSSSKFVENKSSSPDDGLKLSSIYVKAHKFIQLMATMDHKRAVFQSQQWNATNIPTMFMLSGKRLALFKLILMIILINI